VRSRFEKDATTVDIMSAIIGATVIWGLPVLLITWISRTSDVDVSAGPVLPVFFLLGYLATVVMLLKRRHDE
jgi:riboflavin transporter FmnP